MVFLYKGKNKMVKMSQIAAIIDKYNLTELLDAHDYKKLQQEFDTQHTYFSFRNKNKDECTLIISYKYLNFDVYKNEDKTEYFLAKLNVELNWPTYGNITSTKVDELLTFYNTINNCTKEILSLDIEENKIYIKTLEDVLNEEAHEVAKEKLAEILNSSIKEISSLKKESCLTKTISHNIKTGCYSICKVLKNKTKYFKIMVSENQIAITCVG